MSFRLNDKVLREYQESMKKEREKTINSINALRKKNKDSYDKTIRSINKHL